MGALPLIGGIVGQVGNTGAGISGISNTLFGHETLAGQQQYMAKPGDPLTDAQGNILDKFKLSSGDQYSQLAKDQLNTSLATGRDTVAKTASGGMAEALNKLAQRGGAGEGSRLALARQAMESKAAGEQGVTAEGIKGLQDIGMKQFDIGREAEKYNLGNQFDWTKNKYNADTAAWAANETANAQLRGTKAPKGGVVGSVTNPAMRGIGK